MVVNQQLISYIITNGRRLYTMQTRFTQQTACLCVGLFRRLIALSDGQNILKPEDAVTYAICSLSTRQYVTGCKVTSIAELQAAISPAALVKV